MADDSYQVAIEQYVYWRQLGLSDQQMLDALGYHRTDASKLGTRELVDKIDLAWRGLRWKAV